MRTDLRCALVLGALVHVASRWAVTSITSLARAHPITIAAVFDVAAERYDLGQAYSLGDGVAKDNAEAARWWQKAAEQGIAKAQYNLGLAYHAGTGVTKDDVEAYFWINIAASSLEQAFVRQNRDNIGKSLTAAQLSEVQERCRKWAEVHANTQPPPPKGPS